MHSYGIYPKYKGEIIPRVPMRDALPGRMGRAERGDGESRSVSLSNRELCLRRLRQEDVQNRRLKYDLLSVRRRRPDSGGGRLREPGHQVVHLGRGRFGERPCRDAEPVLPVRRSWQCSVSAGPEREPSHHGGLHGLRDSNRRSVAVNPLRVAGTGGVLF